MGKDKKKHMKTKKKDVCCQKFLKKGKHCKGCPDVSKCDVPPKSATSE